MSVPAGYDLVSLNQYLWYKLLCHESTSTEFQRLFENIIKRLKPEFISIRPYGNIGDRKSDGLCIEYATGNLTIYQVYSPDTLTQAKIIKKINEDLDGAVENWGEDLKDWVFVYNVRGGLPPDIPKILNEKQRQYPDITLDHISSDQLWEMARNELTSQQRAEVLGSPAGYEEYFLMSDGTTLPPSDSWIVLIQDLLVPVDIHAVIDAIKPNKLFGAPLFVHPTVSSWEDKANYQKSLIKDLLAKCRRSMPPRFAIFSVAPIPLIVQLGFLLSDSVKVHTYKLHVDTQSWQWPEVGEQDVDLNIQVNGIPQKPVIDECDVLIRMSLSSLVGNHETDEVAPDLPVQIDIFVDNPNLEWIRSHQQVDLLAGIFRKTLAELRNNIPHCQSIHLFLAVPAPIALVIGQQLNPRMNPPIHLYEYSKQGSPRYELALTLKNEQ